MISYNNNNDIVMVYRNKIISSRYFKENPSEVMDLIDGIIREYTDGKKQRYISGEQYKELTEAEKEDDTIVWNITDGETSYFDGDYNNLINKPTIPTKTSELENDSNYATEENLSNYVQKEEGKGLSTNDFTDALYNKLVSLSNSGGTSGGDETIITPSYEELIEKYDEIIAKIDNYYTKEESDEKYALKSEVSEVTVDNVIYGKNGFATLGDYLDELNYVAPKINSFIITPSKTVYEKGVDSISNLILSWSINKEITSLTLTDFSNLTIGQTSVVYTNLISDTKTFTLTVGDGKNTAQSSKTINFVYPFYYGTSNLDTIDTTTVTNGNKIVELKGQKTLSFTYSNEKVFFAYPLTYGNLSNIKDGNGFSYNTSFTKLQITINNVEYYVYISNVKASAEGITYNFIF